MPDTTSVKQLTPLDQSMPRTYISAVFVFKETSPTPQITQKLQYGIEKLLKQIPWLAGKVFQGTSTQDSPLLEIRWNSTTDLPVLIDKGTIPASIEIAFSHGMPTESIPADVWPAPSMLDDASFKTGIPVFASSTFRFADGGMALCISVSHNAVDAAGFAEIVRLWAQNVNNPEFSFSLSHQARSERFSGALLREFQETSSLSTNELFKRHPEYSPSPPAFPKKWPACTSKLFAISMHWINILKGLLRKYTVNPPTTNTIICALIWTSITRARAQHTQSLKDASQMSRLATAVNARQRIGGTLSSGGPFFGNAVFYALSTFPAGGLSSSDETPIRELARICDHIGRSQSASTINSRHIAEVVQLMDRVDDPRSLFVGWDLFGSRDVTITSWADMDLYNVDFGEGMGKPELLRLPYTDSADGVAIVLPRKRGVEREMIEVVIMLRRDHMEELEKDSMWNTLLSVT